MRINLIFFRHHSMFLSGYNKVQWNFSTIIKSYDLIYQVLCPINNFESFLKLFYLINSNNLKLENFYPKHYKLNCKFYKFKSFVYQYKSFNGIWFYSFESKVSWIPWEGCCTVSFFDPFSIHLTYVFFHFKTVAPNITSDLKLIEVVEGTSRQIDCLVESFPSPMSYWVKEADRSGFNQRVLEQR